jgi:hypothetical protein
MKMQSRLLNLCVIPLALLLLGAAQTRPVRLESKLVTIDLTGAPDLENWARTRLLPVCHEWYPKIAALLPSDGFTPPAHFTIRFRDDMPRGVPAMTQANEISCSASWFRRERDRQALGAVVHEMVHIVQHYGHARRRGSAPAPGWLVEGIADYVRWFKYEPQTHGADIRDPEKAKFDGSYRVTANFLDWVTRTYDAHLVTKLNTALRGGTYSESLWKEYTGKTARELGKEWKQSLRQSGKTIRPG